MDWRDLPELPRGPHVAVGGLWDSIKDALAPPTSEQLPDPTPATDNSNLYFKPPAEPGFSFPSSCKGVMLQDADGAYCTDRLGYAWRGPDYLTRFNADGGPGGPGDGALGGMSTADGTNWSFTQKYYKNDDGTFTSLKPVVTPTQAKVSQFESYLATAGKVVMWGAIAGAGLYLYSWLPKARR